MEDNLNIPKISVIIPCFNVAIFLENIFEKLNKQTLHDYEVIFIDDGSTDDTNKLLKEYEKNNSNVKVISLPENYGAGNARNIGIHNSRGEYLIFLDADDDFSENLLKSSYQKAVETGVDILLFKTNFYLYDEKELVNEDIGWLWEDVYPKNIIFTPFDIRYNLFNFCKGALWNKLFKKSLIVENNLFFLNLPKHSDSYFVYTSYLNAKSFYVLDEILYTYTINRPNSISKIIDQIDYIEFNKYMLIEYIKSNSFTDDFMVAINQYH